jgi:hypothetical protein
MILFYFCLCNTNWELADIIHKKRKKRGSFSNGVGISFFKTPSPTKEIL